MNPLTPVVRAAEFLGSVFNLDDRNLGALRRAAKVAVFAGLYAAVAAFAQEALSFDSPLKEIVSLLATIIVAALEKRSRS